MLKRMIGLARLRWLTRQRRAEEKQLARLRLADAVAEAKERAAS